MCPLRLVHCTDPRIGPMAESAPFPAPRDLWEKAFPKTVSAPVGWARAPEPPAQGMLGERAHSKPARLTRPCFGASASWSPASWPSSGAQTAPSKKGHRCRERTKHGSRDRGRRRCRTWRTALQPGPARSGSALPSLRTKTESQRGKGKDPRVTTGLRPRGSMARSGLPPWTQAPPPCLHPGASPVHPQMLLPSPSAPGRQPIS